MKKEASEMALFITEEEIQAHAEAWLNAAKVKLMEKAVGKLPGGRAINAIWAVNEVLYRLLDWPDGKPSFGSHTLNAIYHILDLKGPDHKGQWDEEVAILKAAREKLVEESELWNKKENRR